jgi:hypothetical protein
MALPVVSLRSVGRKTSFDTRLRTVQCPRPKNSRQRSGDVLAVERWSTSQTNAHQPRGALGVGGSQQHSEMVGEASLRGARTRPTRSASPHDSRTASWRDFGPN